MRRAAACTVTLGLALSCCPSAARAGEDPLPAAGVPAEVTAALQKAYPGVTWTNYTVDRAKAGTIFRAHKEPVGAPEALSPTVPWGADVSLDAQGRILEATETLRPGDPEVQRVVESALRASRMRRILSATRTTVFKGSAPDVFAEVAVDDGERTTVLALRVFEVGPARPEWQRVGCPPDSPAGGASEECWALVTLPPECEMRVRGVPLGSRGGRWRAGWTTPTTDLAARPARPASSRPSPAGSAPFPAQAKPGEAWCLVSIPALYETRQGEREIGVEEIVAPDGTVRRVPLREPLTEQVAVQPGGTEWRLNEACVVPVPAPVAPFPGVRPGDRRPPSAPAKASAPGAACGAGKCE